MNIQYSSTVWRKIFAVPSAVAECIRFAPPDSVKVILYILYRNGEAVTHADVSRGTGVSDTGVTEAITFWQGQGVLSATATSTETAVTTPPAPAPDTPAARFANTPAPAPRPRPQSERQFTPIEITEMRKGDSDTRDFFNMYEEKLKRPLKMNELNTAAVMADALPPRVCVVLLNYCFKTGKNPPAYMRKVAADWCERGIMTIALAEAEVTRLNEAENNEIRMMTMFKLHSVPSKRELNLFNKWTLEWKFSDEMLTEAYNITIDQKNEFNVNYMNGILKRWKASNIMTTSALAIFRETDNIGRGNSYTINLVSDGDTRDSIEAANKLSKRAAKPAAPPKSEYASIIRNKALQSQINAGNDKT